MLDLGSILKSGRLRKGMSQITLARKLGVNSSSISRWEKNQQIIAGDTLIEAAKILGIIQELFPDYQMNTADSTLLKNDNVYNVVKNLEQKITNIEKKIATNESRKKSKIVVVEDNHDVQISIQEAIFCLPTRYHIVHMYEKEEIFGLLKNSSDVSLVVISLVSEKINGRKIFDSLQKSDFTKVPIVLITNREMDKKNLNTGLVGYVNQISSYRAFLDVFEKIDLAWPLCKNNESKEYASYNFS
ncbi:helix-turn-helix domain-containing protein [Candidatus Uabimicrobium sp. HlEnr_7]|uniref:helix-turn-helix domain-containing protein n=1 Tax=Candidatus Uabimicrobium helgolandensis TaxID=3095367 RepID=UPI0035561329